MTAIVRSALVAAALVAAGAAQAQALTEIKVSYRKLPLPVDT